MPTRTTTRNFFLKFRQAGIELLGKPPKMSQDVQLVTVIDDLKYTPQGESVPEALYAGITSGIGVVGSNHGLIELAVNNQNGIIIDQIAGVVGVPNAFDNVALDIYTLEEPETYAALGPPLIALLASKPGTKTVAQPGSITDAQLFTRVGRYRANAIGALIMPGFHVSNGRFLEIVWSNPGGNPFPTIGVLYHELPDDQPPV